MRKNKIFITLFILMVIGISLTSIITLSASSESDFAYMVNKHKDGVYTSKKELAERYATDMTRNNIIGRNNLDLVTKDSENYKEVPGISTGRIYTDLYAPNGEPPKVKADNKEGYEYVTEMTGYLYPSDWSTTREEWAEAYREVIGDPSMYGEKFNQAITDIANNSSNIYVGAFAEAIGQPIEIKIGFDPKTGRHYWEVPEGIDMGKYYLGKVVINGVEFTYDSIGRIFVEVGDGESAPESIPESEPSKDDGHRYYSIVETIDNKNKMSPDTTATISSSSGMYNVTEAIPTSEELDFQVTSDESLYNIDVRKYTCTAGVRDITIKIQVTAYYWATRKVKKENEITGEVETVEETYKTPTIVTNTLKEKYSKEIVKYYYDVPTSDIFPAINAMITNVPVDGEKVSLSLPGKNGPGKQKINVTGMEPDVGNTYTFKITLNETSSSYSKARDKADRVAKSNKSITKAKNNIDSAINNAINARGTFNYSYYGLKVTPTKYDKVPPSVPKITGTATNKIIPSTKKNGERVTSGTVQYGCGSYTLYPNNVTVHTPVVNNAKVESESFINQKVEKDSTKTYLQLDKKFTVTIPDDGRHISNMGYKSRTYNSYQASTNNDTNWGKIKDVKLSFDAYLIEDEGKSNETKTFIESGEWLSKYKKATSTNKYTFIIPVWAKEGDNNVYTRVIAENAGESEYSKGEDGANKNIENYVATCTTPVEIVGKIYDLRISSTNDPGWTKLKGKSGDYITASEFPFGKSGQNANKTYRYAPKLGYTVSFDFKTKGIKSNNVDVNVASNGFYFVSKAGGSAQLVDLYYSTATNKYVKLDDNSKVSITTNLTYPYMKVPQVELNDSYRIMKKSYNYSSNVNIGTLSKMNLPENLRMCYNNLSECIKLYGQTESKIYTDAVNGHDYSDVWNARTNDPNGKSGKDVAIGSVGHWWAGYRLPGTTIAVPKGTSAEALLKSGGKEALKNGYIMVKFDIVSKYKMSEDKNYDYLKYTGPESLAGGEYEKDSNGKTLNWTKELTQTVTLPNGKEAELPIGTCVLFESDYANSKDVETVGTH